MRILFALLMFGLNLLIASLSTVFAQNKNYVFTQYNQEQGLISSTLTSIKKDQLGYLWLFSENGVCRFDGYKFKSISNSKNELETSIRIKGVAANDNPSTILFCTPNNVNKISAGSTHYTTLLNFEKVGTNAYFIDNKEYFILHNFGEKIIYIFNSNGNIFKKINMSKWPSTRIQKESFGHSLLIQQKQGLFLFDFITEKFTPFTQAVPIDWTTNIKLMQHPIFTDQVLLILNEKLYDLKWQTKEIVPSSIPNEYQKLFIHSTVFLKSATAYYLLSGQSILIFKDNTFQRIEHLPLLNNKAIKLKSIIKGLWGNIGLITEDHEFYELKLPKLHIQEVNAPMASNGFSVLSNIETYYTDEGVAWLASPGNGLIKMEAKTSVFTPYSLSQGQQQSNLASNTFFKQNIRCFCELDNKQILTGSLNGLFVFEPSTQALMEISKSLHPKLITYKNTPISHIAKDPEGDIWISSWNELKLSVYSKDYRSVVEKLAGKDAAQVRGTIRCFYFDQHGILWLGTPDNKIYQCDWKALKRGVAPTNCIRSFAPEVQKIPNLGIVFSFMEADSNNLLIGCENGLINYNYKNKTFSSKPIFGKGHSVVTNVRAILKDKDGLLWLGTNGMGLISYNYVNDSTRQWTSDNGLGDNFIYSIQFGRPNEIWMGTNNGLSNFNHKSNTFQRFSSVDGLQSAEFNTNASLKTADGHLVFGGIAGLNYFSPLELKIPAIHNPLQITSIWNNGKTIQAINNRIELAYDANNIKIEFAALGHFRNNEFQYAYELVGLTDGWINCETQREATFLQIPPGNYTFRLKVADCFGQWTVMEKGLEIHIATPWFKTWWFICICVLAISLIIILFIREKLRQIEQLQAIRNDIAKDLHDEVGANLSNITLFLALIKQKITNDDKETKRLVEKINIFSQASQDAMSDIVWMINTKNDQFDNLSIKMKDYASSLSEDIPMKVNFHIDPALNKVKMGMIQRKNIYLFFKESFNNAIKYSNATSINIQANLKDRMIQLEIMDNGIGFEVHSPKQGNGLVNMRKRAAQLNGEVRIVSEMGKGTSILLKCPSI